MNQGTFGFVQLAWDKSTNPPQQVAVKFMERGDKVRGRAERALGRANYVKGEFGAHSLLCGCGERVK